MNLSVKWYNAIKKLLINLKYYLYEKQKICVEDRKHEIILLLIY